MKTKLENMPWFRCVELSWSVAGNMAIMFIAHMFFWAGCRQKTEPLLFVHRGVPVAKQSTTGAGEGRDITNSKLSSVMQAVFA